MGLPKQMAIKNIKQGIEMRYEMRLKDKIALNTLKYCEDNDITTKELANRLHWGLPKITRMLNIEERTRRFTINDFENICNALEVNPEVIISYDKRKRDD